MSDPWGREKPRQEKAICDFDVYTYNEDKKGIRYPGDPQTHGDSEWNPFD
jgi:hypothetical protein